MEENKEIILPDGSFLMLTSWVLKQELEPAIKLTYICILFCRNRETGACFPSVDWIAKCVRRDRRMIFRYIDELEAKNFLKRVSRHGTSNAYGSFPEGATWVSPPRDTSDTPPVTLVTPKQRTERRNKISNHTKLFHGKDSCFVDSTGRITIWNGGQKKNYGGGDEGSFRYGNLVGTEAKMAAINAAKSRGSTAALRLDSSQS